MWETSKKADNDKNNDYVFYAVRSHDSISHGHNDFLI